MKALITIWVLAGITAVGSVFWVNHTINRIVAENPSDGLYMYHNTNLKVIDNYGQQKTANIHVLEPKASGDYLQYGHTPMWGILNPQGSQ